MKIGGIKIIYENKKTGTPYNTMDWGIPVLNGLRSYYAWASVTMAAKVSGS